MGTISRWMPPAREPSWSGKSLALVLGILTGLLLLGYYVPLVGFLVGGIALVTTALSVANNHRLRRIAAERKGEDIGTFARGFDRRVTDPWIIRATWDGLGPYVSYRKGRAPLRASDSLEEALRIDPDDLDIVVGEIIERVGRTAAGLDQNPLLGRVRTVADVVNFVNHQPRRPAA